MARIKYTALVESIRGTIGGTTFQRNAYGYTVKTKPNMINPNSKLQATRKIGFQKALQTWRTLSDANRSNWDTYATTYPTASQHNPAAYLNGYNTFVRWHTASFQALGNVLSNPSGAQGTVSFIEIEIIRSGAVLEVALSTTATNGPWYVILYFTRPLSPTQRYQKSWTKLIDSGYRANTYAPDVAFTYNLVYGFLPAVGDLIGVDITFYNTTNGQVIYIPSQIITVES